MPERRPRIPDDLAERIDALRGNTPFERWVREALQQKVDGLLEPQVIVPPVSVTTVDPINVEVHPGDDVGLVKSEFVPPAVTSLQPSSRAESCGRKALHPSAAVTLSLGRTPASGLACNGVTLSEAADRPTVAQLAGRTGLPRAACQRALDDGSWRDL
jgi:hypothetical protein